MGIEEERFINCVPNELLCSICTDVVEDPLECAECETAFCKTCIEDWMSRSQDCPNRCKITLRPPHRILRNILESQQLRCRRYKEGCPFVSDLAKIKSHDEEDCPVRIVKCNYPGCNAYIFVNDIALHEKSCEFRHKICPGCSANLSLIESQNHSCITYLKEIISKLEEISIKNSQEIQYLENAILSKRSGYQQMHPGVSCQKCKAEPIIGIRFKCLSCESYDLCAICMPNSVHGHKFIPMENSGEHEGVTCDSCSQFPIVGLRYKCKNCINTGTIYIDLCHMCKIQNSHEHKKFYIWVPFQVSVTHLKGSKGVYRPGEEFERSWKVTNNGLDIITNIVMICTEGDPCSNLYIVKTKRKIFDTLSIEPGCSVVLSIKDRIEQTQSGEYTATWRLGTTDRVSFFGAELRYNIVILNI